MNIKEEEILDYVKECITNCLRKNVSKNYLANWLEDVINDLSEDTSSELFSILYKIHDTLIGDWRNNRYIQNHSWKINFNKKIIRLLDVVDSISRYQRRSY